MQLSFYLYSYYSFLFDPVALVLTSFDRLELHLVPAILFAAGIAVDAGAHGSRVLEPAARGPLLSARTAAG